ncbi:inner ear-specific collagen-like [Argopecten irradians]|uniref:inner ear-specific collagen-like n=1 Tax=Argopecten irradians TaxID=31199 RepID=UPI0037166E85
MGWYHINIVLLFLTCYNVEVQGTSNGQRTDTDVSGGVDDIREGTELRLLVSSLLERQERQETRLRQLERTVSGHVEDLRRKDVRIGLLERELHDLKEASNPTIGHVTKHLSNVSTTNVNPYPQEYSGNPDTPKQVPAGHPDGSVPTKSIRLAPVDPSGPNAFSASLTTSLNLHPGLIMVFDHVLLDTDSSYNTGDGVYQVPVSGVYVFTWISTGETEDFIFLELIVNGSPRAATTSDTYMGGSWDSATGLVLVHVSAGDHVSIRSAASGRVRSVPHQTTPMFSGWRIA